MRSEDRRLGLIGVATGARDLENGIVERLDEAVDPVRHGGRLADFFASLEDGRITLRLVYAQDEEKRYRLLEWPIEERHYPAISGVVPAAFVEENEIYEQFGVRPAGSRALNRVFLPPHAGGEFPRLGALSDEGPGLQTPHLVTGDAFEFPFGPVRAVAQESLYMGLVTSGEEVLELYLLMWHKHRGLERRLVGLDGDDALFLVERAEGLSAVGNGWAFCRALERIAGVEVDPAVERSRAVALELERLYNHAAATAALCQATGLSVGQAQAEIALEELLRVNLAVFGHRYLFGVLRVGGTGVAPNVDELATKLRRAYEEYRRLTEALWSTNSFVDRLEACGIVTNETGVRLGLVGPVTRGSGCDIDTRRDHPFGPYGESGIEVPIRQRGDVMSRLQVMESECAESIRLISELGSEGLGAGVVDAAPRAGSDLGWCESPRGESLAWVQVGESGRIRRARIRPGSARNWRAFDDAARSRNVFTDVPIIEASFWLTVAGFAR